MEELHTDSINGGHEASYGLGHVAGRGRTPTTLNQLIYLEKRDFRFKGNVSTFTVIKYRELK
jgi:hypothetical protein